MRIIAKTAATSGRKKPLSREQLEVRRLRDLARLNDAWRRLTREAAP